MKFMLISFRKMLSPFQNAFLRTVYSAPKRIYHGDVFPTCKQNYYVGNNAWKTKTFCWTLIWNRYRPTKFRLREPSIAPRSGEKKMTSFIFCMKIPLSREWSVIEVKVMLNTIWHSDFKLVTWKAENIIVDPAIMSPMQASKRTPVKRHEETEKWNEMKDQ